MTALSTIPLEFRAPLPDLPRALALATGQPRAVSYRYAYSAALDGVLPGTVKIGARWFYDRRELPSIARALGLEVLEQAAA